MQPSGGCVPLIWRSERRLLGVYELGELLKVLFPLLGTEKIILYIPIKPPVYPPGRLCDRSHDLPEPLFCHPCHKSWPVPLAP